MRTVNLGILAHVDAGKTSLTERLLHAAGVLDEPGSVDEGSTQTDSLALERQRGITIKSAVVSFVVDDVAVNLIDTPGHPDFIAEVERVLGVLDGAVLVVSAVEGVQAQTRVLLKSLRRLGIPVLVFVNKIDRGGADPARVLAEVADRLTPAVVPMAGVRRPGTSAAEITPFRGTEPPFLTRLAELLAEHDEDLLAAYVHGPAADWPRLRAGLVEQTRRGLVTPVYFGSAITGAGVAELVGGITGLLPASTGAAGEPVSGTVFKVERGPAGERIAYLRLFSGTVRTRDRLPVGGPGSRVGRVTALSVFDRGGAQRAEVLTAGRIGRVWGLGEVRIGDAVGSAPPPVVPRQFAPPTLETVVVPADPREWGALHAALAQLAEQDPLIDVRQDDVRRELAVSLYGEVQKEVLRAVLHTEYGVAVDFRETTTICVERVHGTGHALEVIALGDNPFLATVGLRVEPGPPGSGTTFGIGFELGALPPAFLKAVEETVRVTLAAGLHGWQVLDCQVTMTHSGYWPRQSHSHAVFDKSMSSTAGDFRQLTPLVLMRALAQAGTTVCEPLHRFHLAAPADVLPVLGPVLTRYRAVATSTTAHSGVCHLTGELPATAIHPLRQLLPGLTRGEGELECVFARHHPVRGTAVPTRARTDHNPLDRKEYLLHVRRRV
ncbi:ribosomal protection tetracycline resistance protein [Crossiella equi]|uniref:Ribosomal protection tetracycline resistance protein n=1 Tax=Crossiella equi TaxID=130796 RepID=A0ABS5ABA2_9PSEU|nr:TetM/TetW/TetO/TetS family tetracycline resistance ribosomal protection protein [Crossiella equi]MBP2473849.1 ribosomal protection tetracycline resistance protein [Crossiella equi]